MPRNKKRSIETIARRKAAQRKKETPEQRATRLENMRVYTRYQRKIESKSRREERLKTMRRYARNNRKLQLDKIRKHKLALIIKRCKEAHDSNAPAKTESDHLIKKKK